MSDRPSEQRPRRRRPRFIVPAILVMLVAAGFFGWWLLSQSRRQPDRFTGYVVTDNLYMAAPASGVIAVVHVARGERVSAGAPLFSLDPTTQGARADQARAQIAEASAQAAAAQADLGRAKASLRAAEVQVAKAQADLDRLTGAQREKAGAVAATQIDQARAALAGAVAQREGALTQAAGARDKIGAARAQVEAQRAGLAAAQRQVTELSAAAPVAARVEEVMYQPGEWASANAPVVSLAPDDKVKVRFFVPQGTVNRFKPGVIVALACDGCPAGLTAKVQFVASRPEYTPPVIYSLETREKLVFMVEAVPADPRRLTPGQPMDVRLPGDGRR